MVVQALEWAFLDRVSPIAMGLALGEALEGCATEADELGGGDREGFLEERVLHRAARALPERGPEVAVAHRGTPSSSSARCSARTREFRRRRPPPICRRLGVTGDETPRPGGLDVGELLGQDLRRDFGQPHGERAAEAAALVGAGKVDELGTSEVLE